MTFGIPNDILPIDDSGNMKPEVIENFLNKRRAIEAAYAESMASRIDYPSRNDVLMGRGRPYQEYSGNMILASILDTRLEEYNRGSRFEKTVISYDTAQMIRTSGGRFLQRNDETGGKLSIILT
jgi:hypothetical protein